MKKFIAIFVVIAAVSAGLYFGKSQGQKANTASVLGSQQIASITSSPPVTKVGIPTHLSIPTIHLETNVEQVAQDAQGRMDVPKKVEDVGWYDLGYRPGASGNAVMAGHLDTQTGAPAVFWNLSKLKKGDQIIVTNENGEKHTFEVIDKQNYPYNDFPLVKVFGPSDKKMLNLITCQGTWDKASHNYSNRTVVFAESVE